MVEVNAAAKLERSLSSRMKESYEKTAVGNDLDAEYGDNVGGPPKGRRAGTMPLKKHPKRHSSPL